MAMYLQDPSQPELRDMAVEHWHRSLELNPEQPKIRELIDRYRGPQTRPGELLVGTP